MLHRRAGRTARPSPNRRLTLEALETREVPAAFTDGNLAVLRVGDGSTTLGSSTSAAFVGSLVELTTAGANPSAGANVIALPSFTSGGNNQGGITFSGNANTAGGLNLSADGQFLTAIGFDAQVGTASVSGTTAGTVNRNVALVEADGTVSIAARLNATFSGNNGRGVVTTDGTEFYATGAGTNQGVQYFTFDGTTAATTSTRIADVNARQVGLVGGNVVFDQSASISRFSGQPTTAATPTSLGITLSDGQQFLFLDRASGVGDSNLGGAVDTLYVANGVNTGSLAKYFWNGSAWTAAGTANITGGLFGITGITSGSSAALYATTNTVGNNALVSFTDTAAYDATLSGSFTTLASAGANFWFRGVAFVPKAANQAPVVTLNGGDVSYTENATDPTVLASAATVTDADSANFDTGTLTVAFGANGTADDRLAIRNEGTAAGQIGVSGSNVTFGGTTIGTFTGGSGTTPLVVTFNASATPAAAQALVRNITFANVSENPSTASRTVNFTLTDGDGGTSDTVSRTVTVIAVNDAPVVTAPTTATTNEDTALTFSSANGNAITVSDVDASDVTVTLTATNGTATLGSTANLSVSGNGTATVTLTGTLTAVNTGLNGTTFNPTANFNGAASLQVAASDNGNTGTGGTLTDTETVNITVNAVNDPPVGADRSATINEDGSYTFTLADFGFTDPNDAPPDAFTGVIFFQIPSSSLGSFKLGPTNVSTSQFVAAADIIGRGLVFTPVANANGAPYATFAFRVRDGGGTANGGSDFSTSDNTFTLNVTAVNDAPLVTAPTMASTDEDTDLVFSSANGNAISVSDVDATELTVALTATNGTLTLGSTAGLTVTGDGTATVTLTGTLTAVNAGLSGLIFAPALNFNGSASVIVSATDNGQTGTGGALTDSKTVTVTVNAVNDSPVGASFTVTTDEDTAYTFAASDFGFTDPNDSPANAFAGIVIGSTPTAGTLALNGVAVTSGQFVSASDLAAGLLVFTPADDENGTPYASFTFRVRDDGGGSDTDLAARTATINVTAVNDAPSVALSQATVTTTVGTAFTLNGFAMFNPGGGADEATQTAQSYSVTATNGALFAVAPMIDTNGRLTFTASGTTGTTTVTVTVTDSEGATSAEVQFSVTVETAPVAPSPEVSVNVAVDPTARFIAAGADANSTGTVALFDARTGTPLISFQPFGNYGGGVAVALGDLTGDGIAELIVATRGSIGLLAVYDLATGATLVPPVRPFANLNTGLQITTADVDGDGTHDLVFSPERGAPTVAAFSFTKGQFVAVVDPLPGANLNFQLAAGNVTGDGRAEVILSANGFVAVLDPSGAVLSTFAVAPGFAGEMAIAVGDTNGDGTREIVVALQAPGADTAVAAFTGQGALVWNLFADTGAAMRRDGTNRPAIQTAPRLAVADVTGDQIADILLGSQPGFGTSRVTVFDGATRQQVRSDLAFTDTLGLFTDAG